MKKTLLFKEDIIERSNDEIKRLREFATYILQTSSWEGCDVDGGDAQDKALELGLIELRPIPEEDSIDGEKEHYFVKWAYPKGKTAVEGKECPDCGGSGRVEYDRGEGIPVEEPCHKCYGTGTLSSSEGEK